MKNPDEGNQNIDALFIKSCMEKMDKDIATRFVMSAMSLSKTKIDDAFALACREMAIREEAKKASKMDTPGQTKNVLPSESNGSLSSNDLLQILEDIINPLTKKTK